MNNTKINTRPNVVCAPGAAADSRTLFLDRGEQNKYNTPRCSHGARGAYTCVSYLRLRGSGAYHVCDSLRFTTTRRITIIRRVRSVDAQCRATLSCALSRRTQRLILVRILPRPLSLSLSLSARVPSPTGVHQTRVYDVLELDFRRRAPPRETARVFAPPA